MSIKRIQPEEAATRAVTALGLDPDEVGLYSREGICAALRRAASFLCPASPRQLVDAVLDTLTPLEPGIARGEVADALDTLVGAGDLLELRATGSRTRLLFLGPPSYVEKQPGHYLLTGIRPHAGALVDEQSLGANVAYEAHTRAVILDPAGATEALAAAGLHRVTREQWTRAPRQEPARAAVEAARERLRSVRAPGQVSGLTVIDPTASVRYYKGRWREPLPSDEGMFVGRRPQTYGAPIWCVVELAGGVPQAVLDLPLDASIAPGWDDARRLQAALDAHRGNPQVLRARPTGQSGNDDWIFDFFGPLPTWAERYLDLAGLPVSKSREALFSYRVPDGAESTTRMFLANALWMQPTEEDQEK
ncbi:hypothetical protein ACJ5H2_12025 [Nocardioides sp. R1-1]|uniref:hypothetical protein n=1 Tax=Nocardioides sp. R1-1 TaxID=3383502 RepID=UPI0038D1C8DF